MSLWKNRPKHIAEYFALRFFAAIFRLLPYRAALAVGWVLAFLGHNIFRWRADEARRRIREVFGDSISESRVRAIAWRSMRNLCFNAVDTIRLPALTIENLLKRADYAAIADGLRKLEEEKGGIIVIPHAGSWDQAAVAMSLLGHFIFMIVARQKNPLVDAYMNRMRSVTGIESIHRDNNVVRATIRNLKQGKTLAILTDLRSRTPGVSVDFLGKKANLAMGLGLFARMGNVPVLPAFVTRIGWTRHAGRVFPPIHPDPSLDRDADTLRITQYVMNHFDAAIRAEPEQYFWYNKRWVLEPLTAAESTPSSAELPVTGNS